jgi:hypothetical protein
VVWAGGWVVWAGGWVVWAGCWMGWVVWAGRWTVWAVWAGWWTAWAVAGRLGRSAAVRTVWMFGRSVDGLDGWAVCGRSVDGRAKVSYPGA